MTGSIGNNESNGFVRRVDADQSWDLTSEVVVVGASVAGFAAALNARLAGADTLLLERAAEVGGTARKAGALIWVPNNRFMREKGIADPKSEAVGHMARLARPTLYDADHPTLGLAPWEHAMLEAFYDHAAEAVEELEGAGALDLLHVDSFHDYHSHLPGNVAPTGRALIPLRADGSVGDGVTFTEQVSAAAERLAIPVHTEHRVLGVYVDEDDRVVGLFADTPTGAVDIGAEGAVIFASGGFIHSEELVREHLGGRFLGGCAAVGNDGQFVRIARALGAPLVGMNAALMAPVPLEKAVANHPQYSSLFRIPGDSVILVNKEGKRFANEKAPYNDLTLAHHAWDAKNAEYPNFVSIAVWDARAAELFAEPKAVGWHVLMPDADGDRSDVIEGEDLEALAAAITDRLRGVAAATGGAELDPGFATTLAGTIARFNEFARTGVDLDFHRGETPYEVDLNGPRVDDNDLPSALMHPLAEDGPYYATLVGPGTIDTKGGPRTDVEGRVTGADGEPIDGLYAVGNCAASPTGQAYLSGGGTFGPHLTFGYLAGRSAARERSATR